MEEQFTVAGVLNDEFWPVGHNLHLEQEALRQFAGFVSGGFIHLADCLQCAPHHLEHQLNIAASCVGHHWLKSFYDHGRHPIVVG